MIKTSFEIMVDTKENKLPLVKKWVDRDTLIKTISKVNKELYDDEFGLYDWNELLLRELGVDQE